MHEACHAGPHGRHSCARPAQKPAGSSRLGWYTRNYDTLCAKLPFPRHIVWRNVRECFEENVLELYKSGAKHMSFWRRDGGFRNGVDFSDWSICLYGYVACVGRESGYRFCFVVWKPQLTRLAIQACLPGRGDVPRRRSAKQAGLRMRYVIVTSQHGLTAAVELARMLSFQHILFMSVSHALIHFNVINVVTSRVSHAPATTGRLHRH